MKVLKIRWLDGFKKEYVVVDYQMGKHNYWIKLEGGIEKWIPRENVRHVTISERFKKELGRAVLYRGKNVDTVPKYTQILAFNRIK